MVGGRQDPRARPDRQRLLRPGLRPNGHLPGVQRRQGRDPRLLAGPARAARRHGRGRGRAGPAPRRDGAVSGRVSGGDEEAEGHGRPGARAARHRGDRMSSPAFFRSGSAPSMPSRPRASASHRAVASTPSTRTPSWGARVSRMKTTLATINNGKNTPFGGCAMTHDVGKVPPTAVRGAGARGASGATGYRLSPYEQGEEGVVIGVRFSPPT